MEVSDGLYQFHLPDDHDELVRVVEFLVQSDTTFQFESGMVSSWIGLRVEDQYARDDITSLLAQGDG